MSDVFSGPACAAGALFEIAAMRPKLIALTGGSGAGKSWLSSRLVDCLQGDAICISLDDFYQDRAYLPLGRRAQLNFDRPGAIDWDLFEQALSRCAGGLPFDVPKYDFATHARRSKCRRRSPRPAVLIEGLWLLHRPSVRRLFDLSVYIECPDELRRTRRQERDMAERQRTKASIEQQWQKTVLPMHRRFVDPQARHADMILVSPISEEDLNQLADRIRALLRSRGDERVQRQAR